MQVLLVNKFFHPKGGAEISFFETARLLEEYGHSVGFFSMQHSQNHPTPFETFFVSRVQCDESTWRMKLNGVGRLFYSSEARRSLRSLLGYFCPKVAHLNNIAHQLSPSILHELKRAKVPIVMTLHDYKLVCPSYNLVANGKPCERCAGGRYYHAIGQQCHKQSFLASTLVAVEMTLHHHLLNIYSNVDVFIAPSRFLKDKVEAMGFHGDIMYLPNFVRVPDYPAPSFEGKGKSIVYFGRLSAEKGLRTLCDAMRGLDLTLNLIGDGPEREILEHRVKERALTNIVFWGFQHGKVLQELIGRSMFVVLPSEYYENNPRSVIEAFAVGKPVIGARIGGIPELVKDHQTGLLFVSGDAEDLRKKIEWLVDNPTAIVVMGRQARTFVEKEFNPEQHYSHLLQIYDRAILKSASR